MNEFKTCLAGFRVAAALLTLLCVAVQTAEAGGNPTSNPCGVTFTVSHPDTIGRPNTFVTQLVYTPPPALRFTQQDVNKLGNLVNFKSTYVNGNLVLTIPLGQFPTATTTSFQFQVNITSKDALVGCNYGTDALQGMLVQTNISDGYITTSRFAPNAQGIMAGGTGTPASDIPATIDPTKFTKLANAQPCSPGTETQYKDPTTGCPIPDQVGGVDGNPQLEGGQLSQSPAIRSCMPAGSLTTLIQNPNISAGSVTAFVPNGSWSTSNPGIQVVPIEPAGGTPSSVMTGTDVINSCASNSATGQTLCTANNNNIYLLSTSAITQGQSSAGGTATFSGGSCRNCGVTINQTTNIAAITMGLPPVGLNPETGIQFLDLGSSNFSAPITALHQVSEGIMWDTVRNLILSPSEASTSQGNNGIFDLFGTSAVSPISNNGQTVSAPQYTNTVSQGGGQVILEAAAEDCTTGIAIVTDEGHNGKFYLADLTQAQFSSGAPGTWTVGTAQSFPNLSEFSQTLTTGIAVAPGSHLAIVAGEFGGNNFGVLQLPATSGTGAPNLLDHVAATLPDTPNGPWSQGLDPHTVTAYVSPNDGKAYGLLANGPSFCGTSPLPPTFLAKIDLAAVLAISHNPGGGGSVGVLAPPIVQYISTGVTCPSP